ncbi:PREDICTED: bile salt sulfotransferase isoform X1 [Myotis davidii]|uniref:Sulfotransferase n=1 Tax=Myotis davidii TaxID=225400 RepID=L5LY56_MYODS|nr:PREDICTED: bile salt sulfotransferase isoform X1 [Myotis davidii]ELK31021.1 Bile salt sulfotransferase [Myotis davidii]
MATDYLWIEGIPFHTTTIRDLRSLQNEFVVRDEDVITLSYPKSGTNWIKEIINLIHTRGDPSWVRSVVSWERSPWIETPEGLELIKKQKDPRSYASHLPMQLFPKSLFTSKAKVIYIMRNPRDVIISGYHFHKTLKITKNPNSFEEYFEWFLRGNVPYGSWFDHIGGWLQMRGKQNFLLISYEELHQDLRASVEKVSQFLGTKLSSEELDSVLKNVTFQAMKDNKMSNFSLLSDIYMDQRKACFLRKGITGDWKNQLTVAQSEAFDKVYQEKMAGLPPGLFPWE